MAHTWYGRFDPLSDSSEPTELEILRQKLHCNKGRRRLTQRIELVPTDSRVIANSGYNDRGEFGRLMHLEHIRDGAWHTTTRKQRAVDESNKKIQHQETDPSRL